VVELISDIDDAKQNDEKNDADVKEGGTVVKERRGTSVGTCMT
jgi:hypothetical protein